MAPALAATYRCPNIPLWFCAASGRAMKQVAIGDRRFTLHAVERGGDWIGHAVREDSGDRFCTEREYHRTIAGSAFANPTEGPTPLELQKESLEAVEAARVRLDEIRARQPEN